MQEFIFDLDKCKLFQADSTYVPPPTEEEP